MTLRNASPLDDIDLVVFDLVVFDLFGTLVEIGSRIFQLIDHTAPLH